MFVLNLITQSPINGLSKSTLKKKKVDMCQENIQDFIFLNYIRSFVGNISKVISLVLFFIPSYIFAEGELKKANTANSMVERCGNDAANAEMALGRLEWARKCNLIGPGKYAGGLETDIPSYPTFVGSPRLPFDANAPCPSPDEDPPVVFGMCPGNGCFEFNQRILVDVEQEMNLGDILRNDIKNIMSLGPETTRDKILLTKQYIDKIIKGPEIKPLTVLHMSNGSVLKLSYNHVVFLNSGKAIESQFARENMILLGVDTDITIEKITYETTNEDVWNIQPVNRDPLANTIIAGGVVTGGFAYQNGMSDENLRKLFRLDMAR